jgi:transposase-like protein
MQCPECKSTHINKNGNKKGKQNYICVECGRQFLDCYQTSRGYSDQFKRECLTMYVNGMGLREPVHDSRAWYIRRCIRSGTPSDDALKD